MAMSIKPQLAGGSGLGTLSPRLMSKLQPGLAILTLIFYYILQMNISFLVAIGIRTLKAELWSNLHLPLINQTTEIADLTLELPREWVSEPLELQLLAGSQMRLCAAISHFPLKLALISLKKTL